jgi:hypothetical protein
MNKEVKKEVTVEVSKPKKEPKKFPSLNQGTQVNEGKNWVTGLTHEQRLMELRKHEHKWKQKYNAQGGRQTFSQG